MYTTKSEDYYIQKASEGVGLIVAKNEKTTNYTKSSYASRSSYGNQASVMVTKLRKMVERVHHFGTKVFAEINSDHNCTLPSFLLVRRVSNTTKTKEINGNKVVMNSFNQEEKEIEEYVKLATVAKIAGFDGVQVDISASQSLSNRYKYVMDYTTSAADELVRFVSERFAFAGRIVESIKIVCGDDFPVMLNFKINDDFIALTKKQFSGKSTWQWNSGIDLILNGVSKLELAGFDAFNFDITTSTYKFDESNSYLLKRNLILVNKMKAKVSVPVILETFREQKELAKHVLHKGFVDAIGVEETHNVRKEDSNSSGDEGRDDYLSNYWIA